MIPYAPADGPSAMCSLIMTESNPASSASRAQRTTVVRSRPEVMVQFSLRIRHILGVPPMHSPPARRHPRPGALLGLGRIGLVDTQLHQRPADGRYGRAQRDRDTGGGTGG